MGLSAWIQNVLGRARANATQQARSPQEDFVQLFLTRLEDRRVLNADFSVVAGDTLLLNNFTQAADENLTIQEDVTGTNYEFVLSEGSWSQNGGDDPTGIATVTGANNEILQVNKVAVDGFTTGIRIDDSAAINVDINFESSDFSGLSGSLDVDGAGGISQAAASTVQISTFDVDAVILDLNEAANDFGSVTINVNSSATLRDLDDLSLGPVSTGDGLQVTSGGTLTLTGNVDTKADGNAAGDVTFNANVSLGADVTIDTDTVSNVDGAVLIDGAIDSDTTARGLTIESGDASTEITGAIGANSALASLNVNSTSGTGAITLDDIGSTTVAGVTGDTLLGNGGTSLITLTGTTYNTDGQQSFNTTAGQNLLLNAGATTTFTTSADQFFVTDGTTVKLSDGSNLAINTNDGFIAIRGGILGTSDETVLLDSGNEVTAIGSIGQGDEILSVTISTSATIDLGGDIVTSSTTLNNFVTLTGNSIRLQTSATIDTSAGNGTITHSRVFTAGTPFDFTLNAGTGTVNSNEIGLFSAFPNQVSITGGTVNLLGQINTTADGAQGGDVTITGTSINLTSNYSINTTTDNGADTADGNLTINGPINGGTNTLAIIVGTGVTSINSAVTTGGLSIDTLATATISGQISGTGSVTKLGSGTLVLNNTNVGTPNNYTGNTDVQAGTLQLGAADQLPDSTTVMIAAGAVLVLNDQSETIAQLTGSGNVTLGPTPGNTLSVGDAGNFSFGGVISGNGNLEKQGTGQMTLDTTSVNTYTGTTTITAGELRVNGEIGNGGPAGLVTVQTGTTLSGSGTVNADVLGQVTSTITATGNGFSLGNGASATGFSTLGTLNVANFSITLNDADAAELGVTTFLAGGTLIAANGLVVGNGETLQGTGSVQTGTSNLTIQSGGTLSPGTSPGLVNTNNLVLEAGSEYVVELNGPYQTPGTDFDQTNVTGTVTLNNATLSLVGGAATPAPGTTVVIIQNDGTDAVVGTFNGLAQGATVTVGGFTGRINYLGGDGNDVALEVDGPFNFTSDGGNVTLRLNTTNGTFEIVDNDNAGAVLERRLAVGVDSIIINGDAVATDSLTVDYNFGGFFTQTVTFNGGVDAADNDALIIVGGTFGRVEHTFTTAGPENSGMIVYDVDGDTGTTGDQATINYNGLEPVDMAGSTITDLVFNLPGANDQAILEDDGGGPGNGISQIRSQNGTFETTTFANPTGSVTINLGGDDAAFIVAAVPDLTASLTIDGQAGTDSVNVTGDLTLGSATNAGNFTVTAESVTLTNDADVNTAAGTVGDVTLTATQSIVIDQTSSIVTDGNVTLTGQNVSLTNATVQTLGVGTITATTPKNGPVTGTGLITINASTQTLLNANATLQTGGGVIQITTDDLLINATALITASQANGGVVIIRNASAGREIELGGNTGAAGADLNLTDAELDRIVADSLRIGRQDGPLNAGTITITNVFSAELVNLNTLQLFNGAALVTQTAIIGMISAGNLGIDTLGSVALGQANNDAVNQLAIEAVGSVSFTDATALTINQITDKVDNVFPLDGEDGITGVISTTGFVDLRALTGDLTVVRNVTANGANPLNNLAINLLAAGPNAFINVNGTAIVSSAGAAAGMGAHRYTADNVAILGTINAGANSVNLRNANAGVGIDLGAADVLANNVLELSDDELDRITTNLLAIGRNTGNGTAGIVISQAIDPANTPTLHLITSGAVTQAIGQTITITNLLVEAAGGATLNFAANNVTNLAALIADGPLFQDFIFLDADDVTVGTVDRLTVTNDANEAVGVGTQVGIDNQSDGGGVQVQTASVTGGTVTVMQPIHTDGGNVVLGGPVGTIATVNVDALIETTAATAGQDSGFITIDARGTGTINVNVALTTIGNNSNGGDVTLRTENANVTVSGPLNATGLVNGGDVLIDANGLDADVLLQSTITTNGAGTVTINADDTVTFEATASITAPGAGSVVVRANQDGADGNDNDEILMADGSVIDAGTGTITLSTQGAGGGNVTLGRLVTANATALAVMINSNLAVLDGNGNATNVEALADGSSINIIAVTGVGVGDAIETAARRFDVQNTAGVINVANTVDNLSVEIFRLTTSAEAITFVNQDPDAITPGLLSITNFGVMSASVGNSNNTIAITTNGDLRLAAPLSTLGGTGGTFTLNGGATFDPGAAILLGTGDITLTTGAVDIIINTALSIAGNTSLNAPRDIIVNAMLATTSGNLFLNADTDENDEGGVVVRAAGQVVSAGTLTMQGSDTFAPTPVSVAIRDAVHVEGDGANVQVLAAGDLIIQNRLSANGFADIVLAGVIQSATGTITVNPNNGNIGLNPGNQIHLGGDATLTAPGLILFNAPIADDGNGGTPSNLVVTTGTTARFVGAVGVDPITSLTVTGTAQIEGGAVSTTASQLYNNAVLIGTTTPTTFTAGGNVLFLGTVDGLLGAASDDLVLNVAGTTTFTNTVGGVEAIGDGTGAALTVQSSGETFFNAPLITESGLLQENTAGRITFRENVGINAGDTDTFLNANVTLDGLLLTSNGNVTIGSGDVNFDQLLLTGTARIDTRVASKNVTINSRVEGLGQDLTFTLGGGDLTIFGLVGTDGINVARLGDVTIETVDDFTYSAPSFGPFQVLLSQTLTQLNGTGTTTFNGNVNTSAPNGVTLATNNVSFNANLMTNGGRLLTEAANNVAYSLISTTSTAGGLLVSNALNGSLVMGEALIMGVPFVASIDTAGAAVVLQAGSDLTVGQIRSLGGLVSLTSLNGAVLDGGDLDNVAIANGGFDVEASALRIVAQTGIAVGEFLEMKVANFEAQNDGGGGVFVSNDGALTIGGTADFASNTFRDNVPTSTFLVAPLMGTFTDSGTIIINVNGPMTLNERVQNQGTGAESGAILLQAAGNLTANSLILALDGNVQLTANQSVEINSTAVVSAGMDLPIVSAGNVFVTAGANVTNDGMISSGQDTVIGGAGGSVTNNGSVTAGQNVRVTATNNATNNGTMTSGADTTITAETGNVTVTNIVTNNGTMTSGANTTITAQRGDVTNNGSIMAGMTAQANLVVNSGANTTFNGFAAAMNSGSVVVRTGGDFTLNNGPNSADVLVTGTGQVNVTATGNVNFDPASGAAVQSGTGIVRQPTPFLNPELIATPQISADGTATLSFFVGIQQNQFGPGPGETNFSYLVDWGDGTADIVTGANAGVLQSITHSYAEPPDANNPGADIRVFLVVINDNNVNFSGANVSTFSSIPPVNETGFTLSPPNNSPTPNPPLPNPGPPLGLGGLVLNFPNGPIPSASTINELVTLAFDANIQDFTTAIPVFPVPISGFGGVEIEIPDEPPPFFVPGTSAQPLPNDSTDPIEDAQNLEFAGSEAEEQNEGEVRVLLRVLSPSGEVLEELAIEAGYLVNPEPLWAKLPDGRYQIVVIEPGQSVGLVVRDVELKQHEVIRRFDRYRPNPDGGSSRLDNASDQVPVSVEGVRIEQPAREAVEDLIMPDWPFEPEPFDQESAARPDGFWENWQRPGSARGLTPAAPVSAEELNPALPAVGAAALMGGLAMSSRGRRPVSDVDSQLTQFSGRALSPAARLRRRIVPK